MGEILQLRMTKRTTIMGENQPPSSRGGEADDAIHRVAADMESSLRSQLIFPAERAP
jgi:hypothetical protein